VATLPQRLTIFTLAASLKRIGYNRGMYIDSHCHINFPELAARMPEILAKMADNKVTHALCVSVDLPDFPQVLALADEYPHIYASVGVHPDYVDTPEPSSSNW
jgi:TatD DNase family protein